jgi:hypothetical protein
MPNFSSMRPAPDRDNFAFDFTKEIGGKGTLAAIAWEIESSSDTLDPTPEDRIITQPIFDAYKTSALCGDMVEGVTYTFTVRGDVDDGRIITLWANVKCTTGDPATDPIMTVEQFRTEFPPFANTTLYTDESIEFWLRQVTVYPPIDAHRWGQFYNLGLRLWVAHNLMYMSYANSRAATGQVGSGIATSKSVNGVSVGYDLNFGQEMNAGWYGTTPYGNQFLYYLRLAGMGPIQF